MKWVKKYQIILMIYIMMVVALSFVSLDMVKKQKVLTPPTIASVLFVKENFNPQDTTLITTFTYRQFQYYLPNFENFYGTSNIPNVDEIGKKYLIADFSGTKELLQLKNYNLVDVKEFAGPENIFPRISKTRIYILTK